MHTCPVLAGTDADREDAISQVQRYRQMRYNRLNRELLEVQNNAYRRSGARGSQARKDLIAFEKEVAEATEKYGSLDQVTPKKWY